MGKKDIREQILERKTEVEDKISFYEKLLKLTDKELSDLYGYLEKKEEKDSIKVPEWWTTNGRMFRRDCLSSSHPESTYNYIRNVLGKIPEEYGVYSDNTKCLECGAPMPSKPYEEGNIL